MSAVPKSFLTPEEYLARERRAETKSEYLRGEMFGMSGASREHNLGKPMRNMSSRCPMACGGL